VGESASWYQGKSGFLPPVAIVDALAVGTDARAGALT
jgi:hypothetical protein